MAIIVREIVCITSMAVALMACDRAPGASSPDAGAASTELRPARIGSCDRGSLTGTCSEYAGAYLSQNEILLTSSCAKLGGVFVYAECPNTSVVGACTLSTSEVRKFYGTGNSAYTAEQAQKECETSFLGTWAAR